MANPQRENGYTGIANEILDRLAETQLNGTQFRIIMVVFRNTYGFRRKEHELSESFISKATGIYKRQITRELKELINRKILSVVKVANFTNPRIVSFNKNYEQWVDKPEGQQVSKKTTPVQKDNQTDVQLDTSPDVFLDTQERNTKENIKKDIVPYSEIIGHLNQVAGTNYKSNTKSTREHIHARWEDGFRLEDFKTVIDFKVKEWGQDERMRNFIRPQTLFGTKFESYLNATKITKPKPQQQEWYPPLIK